MTSMTVAIPTWNRAKLLDQTLTQMRRLRIPAGVEWELLVVVNRVDRTDAVIASHDKFLPIRRLFEPTPGVAVARNRAVAEAQGELIVCTDDDVLVDAEWLAAFHNAAQRWPDAGYFGGLIEPWFESPPPAWILENQKLLEGVLALRDFGPSEHYLLDEETPWTANMAMRAAIFKKQRFDPTLGGTKHRGFLGEDSEMVRALRSQGVPGVWVPGARVRHYIFQQRLNRGYVWEHFHRYGRTTSYVQGVPQAGKRWGGVPRWLIRKAFELWVVAHCKRLRSRPDWVKTYSLAATSWGNIAEARRQAREGGRATSKAPSHAAPP